MKLKRKSDRKRIKLFEKYGFDALDSYLEYKTTTNEYLSAVHINKDHIILSNGYKLSKAFAKRLCKALLKKSDEKINISYGWFDEKRFFRTRPRYERSVKNGVATVGCTSVAMADVRRVAKALGVL